jgi:hypothetical protein
VSSEIVGLYEHCDERQPRVLVQVRVRLCQVKYRWLLMCNGNSAQLDHPIVHCSGLWQGSKLLVRGRASVHDMKFSVFP